MPEKRTIERAKKDRAEGKAASTQAGEFIREEMHHIREGKHGARNAKQAIAIGLSQARRAGFDAKPGADASKDVRRKAAQESALAGQTPNPKRSQATEKVLEKEPHAAASHTALSRNAKASAKRRRKAGGSKSPRAVARRAATTRKKSSSSRKTATRREAPTARKTRQATTRKTSTRKATSRKTAARKATTRKATTRKTAVRRATTRKTAARKDSATA